MDAGYFEAFEMLEFVEEVTADVCLLIRAIGGDLDVHHVATLVGLEMQMISVEHQQVLTRGAF